MTRQQTNPPRTASPRPRASRKSGAGGTLLGVFIGLVLGLSMAAAVAFYLMKGTLPLGTPTPGKEVREPAKLAKGEKSDAGTEKPRFDFYKILPGTEEPKVLPAEPKKVAPDRAVVDQSRDRAVDKATPKAGEQMAAVDPAKGAKAGEKFWLQAGSFSSEADAESLKARLAFAGWQANVQAATLADKAQRYRVRLGPYDNTDELNRIRGELVKNGFDVAVIKF